MSGQSHQKSLSVVRYGSVGIFADNAQIALVECAVGSDLNVYVALPGICEKIGIDANAEIERIQKDDSLLDGLAYLPFNYRNLGTGEAERKIQSCISMTRLHTWLTGINQDTVKDDQMRSALTTMKRELADLVYAYFGRAMLPPDLLKEKETILSEEKQQFYDSVAAVYELKHRMEFAEDSIDALRNELSKLFIAVNLQHENSDFIDHIQQDQYTKIVKILGDLKNKRHEGSFSVVERELKEKFNFASYRVISPDLWESIIDHCILMYKRLSLNAPLPQVFKDAKKTTTQRRIF